MTASGVLQVLDPDEQAIHCSEWRFVQRTFSNPAGNQTRRYNMTLVVTERQLYAVELRPTLGSAFRGQPRKVRTFTSRPAHLVESWEFKRRKSTTGETVGYSFRLESAGSLPVLVGYAPEPRASTFKRHFESLMRSVGRTTPDGPAQAIR